MRIEWQYAVSRCNSRYSTTLCVHYGNRMSSPRKIVITGCSRGLGRALVSEFIKAGHQVCGCARNSDAMQALASEHGDKHRFTAVDVTSENDVAQWAAAVFKHFGTPDLVINNAAGINSPAPLWEISTADFQRLMDINVVGVHIVSRQFLPAMIENGSGILVNLSSGWGRSVSANVAPYCASKWAIEGLTKALAEELPSGVAAIPLSPGVIDTDMLREAFGDGAGAYLSLIHI